MERFAVKIKSHNMNRSNSNSVLRLDSSRSNKSYITDLN